MNSVEMEDKPYSVDSSDDINIDEDEHIEENHSTYSCSVVDVEFVGVVRVCFSVCLLIYFFVLLAIHIY